MADDEIPYATLRAESYWNDEVITAELTWLGDEICRRTGQPRDAAGDKGNNKHLSGAHRSQEWIKNSKHCTNRTYTAIDGLTSEQMRHVAGFDFTPGVWGTPENRALMVEQTSRLIAAMKAGLLDEVRQVFGTTDGDTVDGWNNPSDQPAYANKTHLDHWHLTFDRRQMHNKALMQRIVDIALGDDVSADDVVVGMSRLFDEAANRDTPTGRNFGNDLNTLLAAQLKPLHDRLDEVARRPAVDPGAVAAALAHDAAFLQGLAAAVAAKLAPPPGG